jgi:hypothetical protein
MEHYEKLLEIVKNSEENFDKFYKKGNKKAGVRLRKNMQEIRKFAKFIRFDVQKIRKSKKKKIGKKSSQEQETLFS